MTVITTLTNGLRDTIRFGFVSNATLNEDNSLGEQNIFMTSVNGYEGRVLQRDSSNFSCAMELNYSRMYYSVNFDSKVNYRNLLDTSLQNRLFELWYSDNQTDSVEFICDIPLNSFLFYGLLYPFDCFGDPPSPRAIVEIENDTVKHAKVKLQPGLGIKQFIFITNPNITLTSLDERISAKHDLDISVYPNPTLGRFFIQPPNSQEIKEILIYDYVGKLIEQFDSMSYTSGFDLSQYVSGVYIVKIALKNGEYVIKMISKQ